MPAAPRHRSAKNAPFAPMKTKLLFSSSLLTLAVGLVEACATDNGSAVYGDQYGPPPGQDGGDAADGGSTPADDASSDDAGDAPSDGEPPSCAAGTVAVLAGGDAALTYSIADRGGAWKGGAVPGGSSFGAPALAAFGGGFLGVTRGAGGKLLATVSSGGAFGSASTVVASGVSLAPALTVVGTNAHAIYGTPGATANDYVHRTFDGAAWSTDDPVKTGGGAQSFGDVSPAVAPAGTDLVLAQDGTNQGLYVQSFTGSWSTATAIVGAGTFESAVPPVLVPATGAFDLVLFYASNGVNHDVGFATHAKGAGLDTWSSATLIPLAQTSTPFSAALLKPNVVAAAFRGNDAKLYVTFGTIGAASIAWTQPTSILGSGTTDGAPSIAKGVCGDDAIVVFVAGGQPKATRLRGSTWTAPEIVADAAGTRVAVATR